MPAEFRALRRDDTGFFVDIPGLGAIDSPQEAIRQGQAYHEATNAYVRVVDKTSRILWDSASHPRRTESACAGVHSDEGEK